MQSSLKWNVELKLDSNTYPNFDTVFESLPIIFLGQATYDFKAQEVKINPSL